MAETSDDYRVRYHSKDDRGELFEVVHKVTGEVVTPRPMLREYAEECRLLCGEVWTDAELDALRKRHAAIPINRFGT